ncbi:Long wavelength sensitive opsin 8 [Ladona fulva]|uniref:Long wavelength sensitive opsin 8 n=1 Tax=Ladona fulva TaxID=123851 RepID=A0A0C9LM69_LADFU|nr:Long wavelength sensitive opsin 8 [Ladona fulva]FAA01173.1 TPA: opsin, long-wavelength sensitive type [Ladona fulva]
MESSLLAMDPMIAARVSGPGFSNQTVVDMVPPEMLPWVDPHWYQFPPMNPLWHGLLGFAIGVLGFMSYIGNGVVIYIFSTTKSLRTPSNLLVINLAISDFGIMVFMCPFMIINCYYETWVFGPLMCQIYGMTGSLFGCSSIWSMVLIAMDRYNVIVKGIAGTPLSTKKAVLWCFLVWVNAVVWTIFPMFGWNRYVPEGNMTACGTDYLTKDWFSRSYIIVYSFFVYWLPLFVMIYAYFFIVKAVAAHEKQMREQAKKMNVASLRSGDAQKTSAECRLAKIGLTITSLWFLAWTPYLIINYAGIFESYTITPLFTIWGSVFAKANAVYNPIVYGISHPRYRAALKQKLPLLACGADGDGDSNSAASVATEIASTTGDA